MIRLLNFFRSQIKISHISVIILASLSFNTLVSQPTGFIDELYVGNWKQPIGLTFDENGVMYVWEKQGKVFIVENGVKLPTPLIDISEEVGDWRDFGLIGFALDPNFLSNGYIYLLYIVDTHHLLYSGTQTYDSLTNQYFDAGMGRLTRYTANASSNFRTVNDSSRKVLIGETIDTGIPSMHASHGVGSLVFGTDGTLLITTGDGASYSDVDTGGVNVGGTQPVYTGNAINYGILDSTEDFGVFRSQSLNSLCGKVLRIDPSTGNGIPSNPHYNPTLPRSPQSRIWALGLRNPYKAGFWPETGSHFPEDANPGALLVADVGWYTWEELNVVSGPGQNFGWPIYEGTELQKKYYNISPYDINSPTAAGCSDPFYKFTDFLSDTAYFPDPCSVAQEIQTYPTYVHKTPTFAFGHNDGIFATVNGEVDSLNIGPVVSTATTFRGGASVVGDFYEGTEFPQTYHNGYFHLDFGERWIKVIKFDNNFNPVSIQDFMDGTETITDLTFSKSDDALYYISYKAGNTSEIRKISYSPSGNLPPVAVATADVHNGAGPLDVQFFGSESSDPNGDPLTFLWTFGDGTTSTDVNPTHTFTPQVNTPFSYTVTLRVTDSVGLFNETSIIISVNNTPPQIISTTVDDSVFYSMSGFTNLPLSATVVDNEHDPGSLTYEWSTSLYHNDHDHPEPADNNPVTNTIISPVGCDGATYWYRISLTVTDPGGLASTYIKDLYPQCNLGTNQTITFDPIGDKFTNDGPFTVSATSSSGLPVIFYVASGPAKLVGNTITLTGKIGTVEVRATQPGDDTFNPARAVIRKFKVFAPSNGELAQSIDVEDIPDKLTTDAPFNINVSATSGLPVELEILAGPATISGNTITLTGQSTGGTDSVTVRAFQEGDANFAAATDQIRKFAVKIPQLVNLTPIPDKFTNDPAFIVIGSSDASLPVEFFIQSGPASVNSNTVTLSGDTGRVIIGAFQSGNAFYAASDTIVDTFLVRNPCGGIDFNLTVFQPDTCGGKGSVNFTYEGGVLSVEDALNNDVLTSLDSLSAGKYYYEYTNGGCSIVDSFTIVSPELPNVIFNVTDALGCGQTGSVLFNYSSGILAVINEDSVNVSGSLDSLNVGSYTFQLKDGACLVDSSFTIGGPALPTAQVSIQNAVECNGIGSASITVEEGSILSVLNKGLVDVTASLDSLPIGTYTYTVTKDSCSLESNFVINGPPSFPIDFVITDAVDCDGLGSALLASVVDSVSVFNEQNINVTNRLDSLEIGLYTYTAYNSTCTQTGGFEVQGPVSFTVLVNTVDATNCGENGSVSFATAADQISVTDAFGNDVSTQLSSLPVGIYNYVATNEACEVIGSFKIAGPVSFEVTVQTTDATQCGGVGGVSFLSQAPTITVRDSNGVDYSNNLNALPIGNYTYTATDGLCISTDTFSISGPNLFDVEVQTTEASSCSGLGSVKFITTASSVLIFDSLGVNVTAQKDALPIGDYTYSATDGQCTRSGNFSISSPNQSFMLDIQITQPNTCSDSGSVNFVTNAQIVMVYDEFGANVSSQLNALPPGSYTYNATDGFCSDSGNFVIIQPQISFVTNIQINQPENCGDFGSVSISSEAPIVFVFTDLGVNVSSNLNSLAPGNYYYVATNGVCSDSANFTIQGASTPIIAITPVDTLTVTDLAIALIATPIGGVWSGDVNADGTFDPSIGAGTYTGYYTYTSLDSCTAIDSISLFVKDQTLSSDTTSLSPIADAYTNNSSTFSETNYGTDNSMYARNKSSWGFKSYLKFDLSTINSVDSAVLRVYGNNPNNNNPVAVHAFGTNDQWTELGITHNNAPLEEGNLLDSLTVTQLSTYHEFNVTDYIKAEALKDGFGSFILETANSDFERARFWTKEADNNAPELIIYSNPFGKLSQIISFDSIPDKLPTDIPFTISASASSGLEVAFDIVSGPATINGNVITLTGVEGVVTVRATQAGNDSFEVADTVIRTFNVAVPTIPAPETVINPIADAYTNNSSTFSTTNYGNLTTMLARNKSSWGFKSYLKFDLKDIASVVNAKLRVYGNNPENAQVVTMNVLPTTDEWQELTINNDNAPASNGESLGTFIVNDTLKYYEIDVTNYLISQFLTDSTASFILESINETYERVGFNTRENVANKPELVIQGASETRQTQSIVFDPISDKLTTDGPFVITATSSSGLPVSFNIVSGPATIVGDSVTLDGNPGTVIVKAFQNGDTQYQPAVPLEQSFKVTLPDGVGIDTTLVPIGDSYTNNSSTFAGTNYGTDGKIYGRNKSSWGYTSYIKFDLSNLVLTEKATLRIYGNNPSNSLPILVGIFPTEDTWTELGINFNNAPLATGTELGSFTVSGPEQYYEIDVTAYINEQILLDDTVSFLLRSLNSDIERARFNARESGENIPQLIINQSEIIGKLDQTISFDSIPNKTTIDTPFVLSAVSSSGLDVDFTIISGPATNVADTVTLTGATGLVRVRATQAGNDIFNAAAFVERTFLVEEFSTDSVEVSLIPVADSYTNNASAHIGTNYGTKVDMYVRNRNSWGYASYLKFDLSQFSTIHSAILRINGGNSTDSSLVSINVLAAGDNWTETGVNFSNAPATIGVPLGNILMSDTVKYYELDITSYASVETFGDKILTVVLQSANLDDDNAKLNTREADTGKPELVVIGDLSEDAIASPRVGFAESVNVYPNPFENKFSIEWTTTNYDQNVNYRVTDVLGSTLLNESEAKGTILVIQTEQWTSGIYFLTMDIEGSKQTVKLVKP